MYEYKFLLSHNCGYLCSKGWTTGGFIRMATEKPPCVIIIIPNLSSTPKNSSLPTSDRKPFNIHDLSISLTLVGGTESNPIIILDPACTSYAIIHQSIHCSIPLYCVGAKKPTEVIDAIIETGGAGMLFFHRDDEKRKRLHIAI